MCEFAQSALKFGNELRVIDMAESFRVLLQLLDRLRQLCSRAVEIALTKVMHAHRGLDQTLIKEA